MLLIAIVTEMRIPLTLRNTIYSDWRQAARMCAPATTISIGGWKSYTSEKYRGMYVYI